MKLLKKNLKVAGSAPSFEALSDLIKKNLYWAEVRIEPSEHTMAGQSMYDVYNLNGQVEGMFIGECAKTGRWSLFRIKD